MFVFPLSRMAGEFEALRAGMAATYIVADLQETVGAARIAYIKAKGIFGAITPANPVTEGGPGALAARIRIDTADFPDTGHGRSTRYTARLAGTPRTGVQVGGKVADERGGHRSEPMMARFRLEL